MANEDGRTVGTPAVAGGHVYVGDRAGTVHAFRRTDGNLRWRYGQRPITSFVSDKTWRIRAKPAVTEDTVYVTTGIGGGDGPSTDAGNLIALSRSGGEEQWRYEYRPQYPSYDVPRAPVVADGTVFVGDTTLHAVDAADGERRWRFVNIAETNGRISRRVPMESAPVVGDDTVFVGAGALDSASGEKLWGDLGNQGEDGYFYSGGRNAAREGPAVTDGAVFVATQYGLVLRMTGDDR